MQRVLGNVSCDLDPKVKVKGQTRGPEGPEALT